MASIAPMPRTRPIIAAICAVVALVAVAGCGGGDDEPEPSIPSEDALTLISTLQEIQANVDADSCLVAQDKVEELGTELDALPDTVNADVKSALEEGRTNLSQLIDDPDQCSREETTTTEETTTEETSTEETTTTPETTTTSPTTTTTPTTPTQPTNPGGGVSPGGEGL